MPKITTYTYRGTKADGTKVFMPDPERAATVDEMNNIKISATPSIPKSANYSVRTITAEEAASMFRGFKNE